MLVKHNSGKDIRDDWFRPGRDRIFPKAAVKDLTIKLSKYNGSTVASKELTTYIQERQQQLVRDKGCVSITKQNVQPSK